jgi:exopolyphosphatase/guanosine-5'-triphosphate,3'-diphosphate pyrophosphatase
MQITTKFAELERVGVIDIGSNSVRLVVFDGAARSPAYFFNEKLLCGLGRGISKTGVLHPLGRKRAIQAMERFAALAASFDVQSLEAVATAAVRDAGDGPAFCAEVRVKTGIEIRVISGQDEARYSAQGVLLGRPEATGLVSDLGGASMELAAIDSGAVGMCLTSPLAPLRLTDVKGDVDKAIRKEIRGLLSQIGGDHKTLHLVGGSYRAIAKIDMARRSYPLEVLHEYTLSVDQLNETLDWIDSAKDGDLSAFSSSTVARLTLVPMAARILRQLVTLFAPEVISVSSYGLREGMLYERMPPELRRRDPLIEACRFMERSLARFAGFGEHLAAWVAPLLPDDPKVQRLVLAAGLLHDVSWRSDPNSRAEECFDNAMRGNLGGLRHRARVTLAMALLHRYRKNGKLEKYKKLKHLLTEEEQIVAQVIGQAMRLGASLAAGDANVLRKAKLHQSTTHLELRLDPSVTIYSGEIVETRLHELAACMGCQGIVKVQ